MKILMILVAIGVAIGVAKEMHGYPLFLIEASGLSKGVPLKPLEGDLSYPSMKLHAPSSEMTLNITFTAILVTGGAFIASVLCTATSKTPITLCVPRVVGHS